MESDTDTDSSVENETESGTEAGLDGDFSDHSFQSDTDSEENTCSTLETLNSQVYEVDQTYWSDELHDVDIIEFEEEEVGPCHQLGQDTDVLQYFYLMLGEEFLHHMSEQTNLYARQRTDGNPDTEWYDTTIPEMLAFIGMLIYMRSGCIGRVRILGKIS